LQKVYNYLNIGFITGIALDYENIHGILGQTTRNGYHFDKKHPIEGTTKDYQINNPFWI